MAETATPLDTAPGPGGANTGADWAPVRLAVRRLSVSQFRCYDAVRLECDARPVVLTGPNGAGKTNLLEALSFLTPGKGLRRAALPELKRLVPGSEPAPDAAATGWAISARLDTPTGPVDIGTGRDGTTGESDSSERRLVRVDGVNARSQTVLADHVAAVWLTPQMDRLFIEGRSERRRFLDRLVYGLDPAHASRVAGYEKAMRERIRLLREGRMDRAWLAGLEEIMAQQGVAVAAARAEYVRELTGAIAADESPFPHARLQLTGEAEQRLESEPALAVEDWLRERLAATRALDAAAGTTTEGPHRCDLSVYHVAKNMPAASCSTGEQKALLIAIVLANARLITARRGFAPLLLLDEVAAHLDARRRTALYTLIGSLGAQAWLTGTDDALFAPFGDRAQFYAIEDARIAPAAPPQNAT